MRLRARAPWSRLAALAAGAAALAVPSGAAAGTAFFTDGRGMHVLEAWLDEDGLVRLRLPEGGVIGTHPDRIARVVFDPPAAAEPAEDSPPRSPSGLVTLADEAARRYGVDELLVRAIIQAESGFDPAAMSPVGAMGLMQLMPGTAADMEVEDAFDPHQNVDGGVRYLRWMLDRFEGRLELALAAYNAGPAAVTRYGGMPPFPETRAYVRRVLALASR